MTSFPVGSWEPAKAMAPLVGRLYPQLMQPIRKVDTFEPKSHTKVGTGVVFDMGQNMAGLCTLTFNPANVAAARDTAEPLAIMLRLRHTEITSRNGSTFNNYYPGMEFNHASATCSMEDWYENKWYECANQTDGYVFSVPGNVEDVDTAVEYTPSFTYLLRSIIFFALKLYCFDSRPMLHGAATTAFATWSWWRHSCCPVAAKDPCQLVCKHRFHGVQSSSPTALTQTCQR